MQRIAALAKRFRVCLTNNCYDESPAGPGTGDSELARLSGMISIRRVGLTVGVSVIALSVAAPAQAQTQAAEDADDTEIVVTAQFREQKLQDTPLAITAVSAELIEARSATNLADVTKAAPSVVLRPSASAFGNSVSASIRGLGQGDFNPALEPGVGLYIDDVYYPRLTGANFDLLDVERVEVLRGPQGTLTGRNSEGGAIKFISRKPTGEGGYVSATYGSRNRVNLRASADFKLAENLFARLSGTLADQEGYVDVIDYGCAFPASGVPSLASGSDCELYKQGDVGYKAVKAIVRFNPTDALDIRISADYNKDVRNSSAEVLLYAGNDNPNVQTVNGLPLDNRFICGRFCNYTTTAQPGGAFIAGLIPPLNGLPLGTVNGQQKNKYEGWGVSGNIDYNLSDAVQLQSISAYREWDNSFTIDGDLSPARTQIGNNDLSHWFWSQEFRLNAELSDALQVTLGGYYSDEKTTYYTLQDIRYVSIGIGVPAAVCAAPPPPGPTGGFGGLPTQTCPIFPLQFIGNDPVRTKSKAVFGTAIFKATDALTLTGGFRYTKDSKDYTYFRFNLDGATINPFVDGVGAAYGAGYSGLDTLDLFGPAGTADTVTALTGRTASFRGSRWDYRFSLDYRFSPELLAYATTSTGYKAGGVGPRPFNAAQARPFGEEEVVSYELGIKTDLFDRKLRFNVSAYYNELKDAQLTLLSCPQFGGPGPCALPQNAGDATQKGVEFEVFFKPVEGLTFDAAASYIKYKFKCVDPQVVNNTTLPAGTCSSDPAVIAALADPAQGWQWNLGVQYEADLGGSGTLTPRLDVNRQNRLPGNVLRAGAGSPAELFGQVPGYTLANARLTWRNGAKDFDKYYFPSKFDLSGLAGSVLGNPGRSREWALSIKKKF
jgi:iron complex outermembrane recepter protein